MVNYKIMSHLDPKKAEKGPKKKWRKTKILIKLN